MPYESLEERLSKAAIRKQTLETFTKKGGYAIVKPPGEGETKWRGINDAVERTGLNRNTITRLLREFPEPPEARLKGKTIEAFEQSQAYTLFKERYPSSRGQTLLTYIRRAFEYLRKEHKITKDPMDWEYDEYRLIWKMPEFKDPRIEENKIDEHKASAFHNLMRLERKNEETGKIETKAQYVPLFKGGKLPAGVKKGWYLTDGDIKDFAEQAQTFDILMFGYLGLCFGARSSSLVYDKEKRSDPYPFTPNAINPDTNEVTMFEPKLQRKGKGRVDRFIHKKTLDLVLQFIKECKIGPDSLIFPHEYRYYNDELKKIVLQRHKMTTHILKHTFVTQAYNHGLSQDTVEHQTGTETRTLKAYYTEPNTQKMKAEITGEHMDGETFYDWVSKMHEYFKAAYERIKNLERNGLLQGGKVQPNHERIISASVGDATAQSCECDFQQSIPQRSDNVRDGVAK